MSDNDDIDIDGGESSETSTTFKKKSRLAALLPTILKFAAIGIGALAFIVTIVVITMDIRDRGGRAQTVTDPASPFVGVQPILQWFTEIGTVNTQTRDGRYTITVVMNLGFDQGDTTTSSELFGRQHELRDFTRRYFASRGRDELMPENEPRLRREIMEILNTQYLSNARIRSITFARLDVMEVF